MRKKSRKRAFTPALPHLGQPDLFPVTGAATTAALDPLFACRCAAAAAALPHETDSRQGIPAPPALATNTQPRSEATIEVQSCPTT